MRVLRHKGLVLAVIVGGLLRFLMLGSQSLWVDETGTLLNVLSPGSSIAHFAFHGNSLETARLLGHKSNDEVLFGHYRALAKKADGQKYFAITSCPNCPRPKSPVTMMKPWAVRPKNYGLCAARAYCNSFSI